MLIDTHSHLNFKEFDKDREQVIKRCLENNVWLINVGTNYTNSEEAVKIAEKYPKGIYPHTKQSYGVGVYAAIGLHPIDISKEILGDNFDYEKYKDLAKSKKVVAIGEIGLDFPCEDEKKEEIVFLKQLKLARELNLPIIIHCRKAHDNLLKILELEIKKYKFKKIRGVIHCFTGRWAQAKRYLEMGFYLGFNGIIYKLNLDKIIKKTPLDKILIETDCPYLTPPLSTKSFTGARTDTMLSRNEPLNVKYIAETIGRIKNKTFNEVSETTFLNARKLFEV